MTSIGQIERATQNRVIKLFHEQLQYRYLGDWEERANNSNVETGILTDWLTLQDHSPNLITKALHVLVNAAKDSSKSLYEVNKTMGWTPPTYRHQCARLI